MTVSDQEVIPMEKYHHCELCHYKTKRSNNLKKHMAVHRNSKVIRETKCQDCGHQFKRHHDWKKHRGRGCKMDLSGKVTVDDNIKMLNANMTTSQIKLNNQILRKSVGKKKVQSNIDRLLRKAKDYEKKQWKCVKVKLWEKNASGKRVLVETWVSVPRNATKYMLRVARGRGYLDPRFCCVADGGQNKFLLSCTLTDKSDVNDDNHHKATGSMMNLLLLNCDVNCEIYENMVILSKLLNLDKFPYTITFSGDLKLVTAWLGLSGPSGKHGCPYCTAQREDLGERKKGIWFSGEQRTYRRLLEQHQMLRREKKNKPKNFENCKYPYIRLRQGDIDMTIIHEIAPGPLHCFILGKYFILFSVMIAT